LNPQKNQSQEVAQVTSWVEQIIKKYKLMSTSSFDEIVHSLVDFFSVLYPEYRIVRNFNEQASVLFYVTELDENEPKSFEDYFELDVFDLMLLEPDVSQPMTATCEAIAKNIENTFRLLLVNLKIIAETTVNLFLDEIKKGLEEISPFNVLAPTTINWAKSIIKCFQIDADTPAATIEKKVIFFMDMLYEDYSIKYSYINDKQFPIEVKKHISAIGESDVLKAFRSLTYAIYNRVLQQLDRNLESSNIPDHYWW